MPKPKNSDLIKLNDVPKVLLELTGVFRCRATVYNWARNGRPDYTGKKVKLKTCKRVGSLYTSQDWLIEFLKAIG